VGGWLLGGAGNTLKGSTPAAESTPASLAAVMGGTVTLTSAAAQNPAASPVAALVNRYFAAINALDYQAYLSLLTPQEQHNVTATQFASTHQSGFDSNETITGISAADGKVVAQVTFTSHQNPVDSVDGAQPCTDWQILLFLVQNGRGYLIDQPPPGYHPSHSACP
jgi:hypothetical protein